MVCEFGNPDEELVKRRCWDVNESRIVRAFLIEEQKIVQKVLKAQQGGGAAKTPKKTAA